MNIAVRIGRGSVEDGPLIDVEDRFVKEATARGLLHLQGHRSVGGLRVSLYNSITLEETKILAEFMKEFETNNKGV